MTHKGGIPHTHYSEVSGDCVHHAVGLVHCQMANAALFTQVTGSLTLFCQKRCFSTPLPPRLDLGNGNCARVACCQGSRSHPSGSPLGWAKTRREIRGLGRQTGQRARTETKQVARLLPTSQVSSLLQESLFSRSVYSISNIACSLLSK